MKRDIEWSFVGWVILFIIALGCAIFGIYLNIKYATTPIGEIPLWVTWFIFE